MIHVEQCDSRSTNIRLADDLVCHKSEVLMPLVDAWIEKSDICAGLVVVCKYAVGFPQIATWVC